MGQMSEFLPIVLALASLALLPFAAMMLTCFAKIVVVLGLLRQALGLQQVPPNMVINGIAMIMTMYVMAPVGMQARDNLESRGLSLATVKSAQDIGPVIDSVATPLREFLLRHTEARDRHFFVRTTAKLWPPERAASVKDDDFLVLVPAFTVSELTKAFQVGFLLFLAFVIVDLLVANIVLAMGMSMVSPTVISVPFKVLLFVMLDGWARLLQGLVLGY